MVLFIFECTHPNLIAYTHYIVPCFSILNLIHFISIFQFFQFFKIVVRFVDSAGGDPLASGTFMGCAHMPLPTSYLSQPRGKMLCPHTN